MYETATKKAAYAQAAAQGLIAGNGINGTDVKPGRIGALILQLQQADHLLVDRLTYLADVLDRLLGGHPTPPTIQATEDRPYASQLDELAHLVQTIHQRGLWLAKIAERAQEM